MSRRRSTPLVAVVIALTASPIGIALCGCENEPPKTALGYTEGAKHAYDQAMIQFKAHQWMEAQTLMHEVKRKYSYSKYARLAELRIADADFEQEKFSDAIREYKEFIHAHRSDEEDITYARSRIADATFAEIPESFLMPASEERDQASVVDAYKELLAFLVDYPRAKEVAHVRELLGKVTSRLIRHELYVARFYLGKDNYGAAVARIRYALTKYPAPAPSPDANAPVEDHELQAEGLLLLGETFLKMRRLDDARHSFEVIVSTHGRTPAAVQARNYLASMRDRGG
ncbi:MAG: outer membrane protein assembly factor BamD [Polyangiaceae bacterium]|jgi:outer membrane protein assembly factor BamD